MTLTPAQQAAVQRSGPDVCVVAGPGSGKTRVLIERFAWLVEARGIAPARILAITFTEKAATEIKQRLIQRFSARPEVREAIERAWVSTIDGFCARLLRENAIAAGLAPDFAVLDQAAAGLLAREAAEEVLDALFQEQPGEMRRLIVALDLSTQEDGRKPDLARSLLDVYEAMRVAGLNELPAPKAPPDMWPRACELASGIGTERGADAGKLHEWAREFLALPAAPLTRDHFEVTSRLGGVHLGRIGKNSPARELKNEAVPRLEMQWLATWNADLHDLLRAAVTRIDALYHQKKRADSVLDFADLEQEAVRFLESDDAVRQATAARFDQILMDEVQDTNRLQWRLVDLIRRNFFVVGDINQSIYGFRHAEPAVFEEYRRALQAAGAEIDDLRENHRSRAEILDTVSRMLDGQPGIEPRRMIAAGQFSAGTAPAVERLVGRGDQPADAEAALVAARIREMVDSGEREYRHIAILVRALGSIEPFERALDRLGIPFLVSGGRTFLEARETRDLLALVAALVNPLDEIALIGVLRSPLAGLSDEEIFRIGREGWRAEFDARFGRFRSLAGFIAPDRVLATALDESGYVAGLPDRARANLEKLLGFVRREHRTPPRPLAELLEDLEALRTSQSEAEAPPPDAGDTVRLMTIHAAKGLEFPVAFVGALHRGVDRRKPVIAFSPARGLGAKWRHPASGKGQSDATHAMVIEELQQKEEAEENRLLYVAMTRAEERLILSYAERRHPSGWQKLAEAAVPESAARDLAPRQMAGAGPRPTKATTEELLEPPLITGQHDSTAAVTSVAMFHACPRRYYLSRYLGLEPRTNGPSTGGIALGLEVHRILAGEAEISPDAAELARKFRSSELGLRAARATRIEREFDFLFYVEDIVLRGQIDLWFEESGELLLVDYKTDREESPPAYELQLRLYALALEWYVGRVPDRAVVYYLRSDRTVEISLASHELHAAREEVQTFQAAQQQLEFPLHPGDQCRRCPFFGNHCPAAL